MADFYQTGSIATLHRLGQDNLQLIENELLEYRASNPIALVLPCLYSELQGPALGGIVNHLTQVSYLKEIVIALSTASALEFRRAKDYFKVLPQHVRLIWIESPRVQETLKLMVDHEIESGIQGKGQSCGIAFGF